MNRINSDDIIKLFREYKNQPRILRGLISHYIDILISSSNEDKNYYYIIKMITSIIKNNKCLDYSLETAIGNTKYQKEELIHLKKQLRNLKTKELYENMDVIFEILKLIGNMDNIRNETLRIGENSKNYRASIFMNYKYTNYEKNIENNMKKLKK